MDEWNLLSFVFKNAVDSRRAAWRVTTSVEQKEKFKGEEQVVSHAREHVAKVEGELQKIRDGLHSWTRNSSHCLALMSCRCFYYKMKGDYYRHFAEFATGETKSKADGRCLCRLY